MTDLPPNPPVWRDPDGTLRDPRTRRALTGRDAAHVQRLIDQADPLQAVYPTPTQPGQVKREAEARCTHTDAWAEPARACWDCIVDVLLPEAGR